MKKLVILSTLFYAVMQFPVLSQQMQGTAYYTSIVKNDMKIDSSKLKEPYYAEIYEAFSKPFYDNYVLNFVQNESNFSLIPKLEKPNPSKDSRVAVTVSLMSEGEILYKNLSDGIFVNNKEIMGKRFLVVDSIPNKNWKLVNESKMIGDYVCFKAIYTNQIEISDPKKVNILNMQNNEQPVIVWYTPQIPIGNGPLLFDGLPGLILEVNEGEMKMLCTKIILNPAESIEIKIPNKGKVVNQAEFKTIMNTKMHEMLDSFNDKIPSRN